MNNRVRKKIGIVSKVLNLLGIILLATGFLVTSINNPVQANGTEVCPDGGEWTKVNVNALSYTYNAPSGYLIVEWCYKAATTVNYGVVNPPAASVTINSTVKNDNGQLQNISHASFRVAGQPTNTPTNIPTNTPTNTSTNTPTHTPTNTPTHTPTDPPGGDPTQTLIPTNTPTDPPGGDPTQTPVPTDPPGGDPTQTLIPTNTPTDPPAGDPTQRSLPTDPPATPADPVVIVNALPVPESAGEVLIPVTGADLNAFSRTRTGSIMMNLGSLLLGLGLVLYGISRKQ